MSDLGMEYTSISDIQTKTNQLRTYILDLATKLSISQQQEITAKDAAVKGPIWVSTFETAPPKEDPVTNALMDVIDAANPNAKLCERPTSELIQLQWNGFRKDAVAETPEPSITETQKYERLLQDVTQPVVILFVYGGAFYMNSPASYRQIVCQLAQRTGGRCLTFRQRLAPQHPFPAVLLDLFHAYLTLLAPPPGSPHSAIPASSIVLAGDSSGANIVLAFVQVLLRLRRRSANPTFVYHGRRTELCLPAGITLISASGELANASPSFQANADYDWFPQVNPYDMPGFPTCELWPCKPPRASVYCEAAMFRHPFCSPALCTDWTGCPPLWFASGQEQLVDAPKLIAKVAFSQGVTVYFQEYQAMPHIFLWRFGKSPQAKMCWTEWAKICTEMVAGRAPPSKALLVQVKDLRKQELDLANLIPLDLEKMGRLVDGKVKEYEMLERKNLRDSRL